MEASEIQVRVSYLSDIADSLREIELCLKEIYFDKDNLNREMKKATNILLDNLEYAFLAPINAGIYKGYTLEIFFSDGHYVSRKYMPVKQRKVFDAESCQW